MGSKIGRRHMGERNFLLYGALFLAAMVTELAASGGNIPHVLNGGLFDPDSFMRLVRIQQGLKLGHLVNVVQRDDSGAPLLIEWSRLFDAIIVGLAAPLAPWIGWHRALFAAGVATGPLSAGLLGAGMAFAVAPICDRAWLWAAPVVGLLLPGIRGFSAFGIIHYHIFQLALVSITAGFALRSAGIARRNDWLAGISGGFAIWATPETMPFVLLCYLALGYVWLFKPVGFAIARVGAGFLGTLLLGLWLDPPLGGLFAPEIDRLSTIYAMLGVAVFAAGFWLMCVDLLIVPADRRSWWGAGGALAAFSIWLAVYPAVALGPYAIIPAKDMEVFFGHLTETQPVRGFAEGALLLGPAILALMFVGTRAWKIRHVPVEAGVWGILGIGIMLSLVLTDRFVIFQQYPAGFAGALLPVALSTVSKHFVARPQMASVLRIGTIMGVLVFPYVPEIASASIHRHPHSHEPSCSMRHIAPLMAPAAGKIVLTPMDDVAELLYRTRIIGVGSLYQHGVAGYLRAWHAWRTPAGGRQTAIVATGARFVLFCPEFHSPLLQPGVQSSLWAMLSVGKTPSWLTLIGQQKRTGFRLYRISDALE